ncbi:hypothetical protein AALA17_01000 [Lactobacillaceae bacterium 24-114]
MQMEQSIFKTASNAINHTLHQLIKTEAPSQALPVVLLTPQPKKQRQLFLQQVMTKQLRAFFQLIPVNNAGYPVNIYGTLKKLKDGRYLIHNRNIDYVVNFDQIRYVSNI